MPFNATRIAPRSFLYDLGNNFAGVARVSFKSKPAAKAGDEMTVVCTEYVSVASVPRGPADMYNQQDLYIFSGTEQAGDS